MLSGNYCRKHITCLTKCLFDLSDKSKECLIAILISQYILWVITETHIVYKEKYQNIDVRRDVPILSKKNITKIEYIQQCFWKQQITSCHLKTRRIKI